MEWEKIYVVYKFLWKSFMAYQGERTYIWVFTFYENLIMLDKDEKRLLIIMLKDKTSINYLYSMRKKKIML